jgi:hypothetical protein
LHIQASEGSTYPGSVQNPPPALRMLVANGNRGKERVRLTASGVIDGLARLPGICADPGPRVLSFCVKERCESGRIGLLMQRVSDELSAANWGN